MLRGMNASIAPLSAMVADTGFTISSILGGLLGVMLIVYGVWTLQRFFGRGSGRRNGRRR